jgi:hypothetical protein
MRGNSEISGEEPLQLLERVTNARVTASLAAVAGRIMDIPGGGASLSLPGAKEYASYSRTVPGWFLATDLHLFDFILARQLAESLEGDVLEIGCYQGRSTILLGYGLRDADELVVCDLFGADPDDFRVSKEGMAAYVGLTVDGFYKHYDRFHPRRPQVEICPSTALPDRIQGRRFRFLHIDGSHAYDSVCADIAMAVECAADGAVVVLDDYRSPHTPGVSAATWEAVAAGLLYPFCISEMKLYAAVADADQSRWLTACRQLGAEPGWESEVHVLRDHELVRLGYRRRILGRRLTPHFVGRSAI